MTIYSPKVIKIDPAWKSYRKEMLDKKKFVRDSSSSVSYRKTSRPKRDSEPANDHS